MKRISWCCSYIHVSNHVNALEAIVTRTVRTIILSCSQMTVVEGGSFMMVSSVLKYCLRKVICFSF